MHTVEAARESLAAALGDGRARREDVPLAEAHGRILALDVAMDHDVPPFDRATMDGFAVLAEDAVAGRELDVVGRVVAGDPEAPAVMPGQAVRIMTGAPLPAGASFVIPFEWTDANDASLRGETQTSGPLKVLQVSGKGPNWVPRGAVIAKGGVVVSAGTRLDGAGLGALAAAGAARVPVYRKPRVAILGTGTELVPVDTPPGPGRIRNSNSIALAAQVEAAGGHATPLGIVTDDLDQLRAAIRRGLEADLFLLSGGVSRGDLDLVPGALEAEGVRCIFHRWAVQPGGPLWFGEHTSDRAEGGALVFGLPGNPAATFVGFELLVRAAIDAHLGRPVEALPLERARLVGAWGRAMPRRRFRPVTLRRGSEGLEAHLGAWRGSGNPFAFVGAAGFAVFPENVDATEAGEAPEVDVLRLTDTDGGAR